MYIYVYIYLYIFIYTDVVTSALNALSIILNENRSSSFIQNTVAYLQHGTSSK
jgi:hypothetical protein